MNGFFQLRRIARRCGFVGLALAILPVTFVAAKEGPEPFDVTTYMRGKRVFESQCIPCHGRNGRGDGEWSVDVKDKPRNLTLGVFKFRTTPIGFLPTQADLLRTLRTGISGTMMPTFAKLPDPELEAVIAYVRSFSPRWEDPKNYAEPIPLPPTPAWFAVPSERAQHAAEGAKTFQQVCAACHGAAGKGDGPASAGLKDVAGRAITPADLSQPHHKSGPDPIDLYRTISMGLDGTPMVGFREAFGAEKMWDLVAYIRSLAPPESAQ